MNAPPISAAQVAAFLRERGWRVGSSISPIEHGEWSRAFSFAVEAGRAYVVRFSERDADFRKDQVAAGYASAELPIPRIVEIGDAFDGFYAISERARGTFIDALEADQLAAALPSLWAAVDALRRADLSATHGFGMWDATGEAPLATWRQALLAVGTDAPGSRIAGWRPRLEASPTGAESFDRALRRLEEMAADLPEARHLVHADLLNFNVLVEGERVAAVLDWGASVYGDWVFDVAWFEFWQPWYPAWSGLAFAASAWRYFSDLGVDLVSFSTRLRCCEIAIGLENQAYCAFKGESRYAQLEQVARRTLSLLNADGQRP